MNEGYIKDPTHTMPEGIHEIKHQNAEFREIYDHQIRNDGVINLSKEERKIFA